MAEEKEMYMFDEDDIITLEYDNGEEVECASHGVFEVDGKEYIALTPLGTDELYIYRYKEYEEDFDLLDITDEKEFEKALNECVTLMNAELIEE